MKKVFVILRGSKRKHKNIDCPKHFAKHIKQTRLSNHVVTQDESTVKVDGVSAVICINLVYFSKIWQTDLVSTDIVFLLHSYATPLVPRL